MRPPTKFKCLHCKEEHRCDPRKRGRQHYCIAPECRRASKAASQRRWVSRPENRDYFRGRQNCERVRQWRSANPGYWRQKGVGAESALQDLVNPQNLEDQRLVTPDLSIALQEMSFSQHALFVGLIAVMTGHTLQDEIATSARSLLSRGRDILRMVPGGSELLSDENQTHFVPRTSAARAAPI